MDYENFDNAAGSPDEEYSAFVIEVTVFIAILFPVFAKAREKARQISCASNLKQLSIGMMQYTQD